jgi:hypothetical protein
VLLLCVCEDAVFYGEHEDDEDYEEEDEKMEM